MNDKTLDELLLDAAVIAQEIGNRTLGEIEIVNMPPMLPGSSVKDAKANWAVVHTWCGLSRILAEYGIDKEGVEIICHRAILLLEKQKGRGRE